MTSLPPTSEPVEWVSVDRMRRDAVLVARGAFLIALLPALPLMNLLIEIVRDLPGFDPGKVGSPLLWGLIAATAIGFWYLRRFGGALCTRCLQILLALQVLALIGVAAAATAVVLAIGPGRLGQESPATVLGIAAALGIPTALLLVWAVLRPMAAARRLLATRLAPADTPLTQALEDLAKPVGIASIPDAPARTASSRAHTVAAFGVGIITAGVVLWLFARDQRLLALAIEFAALYVVIQLLRRGKRLVAVDAGEQLRRDARAPVLYLRSFQDDAELFAMETDFILQLPQRATGPAKPASGLWRRFTTSWLSSSGGRLEEALADVVAPIGPFVAIGQPNEPLPELGAARAYFSNDTWQGAIQRWVDMAGLIVKVAGPTTWIRWELDTIIRQGALSKLIIVLPPGRPEEAPQRWANITAELDDTPWGASLATIDPASALALRFLDAGRLGVVMGTRQRHIDYSLAFRILLHQMRLAGRV